ncbi:hypothetical protein [Stappia sp. ES.058]|uniref:hypothetical protein n=1 Tax=Stappia sp. ES.058 TaxID=1881061 RepID=UPI0012FE02BA|nr:hypothetical protein [Stappia sp. ES.058]
MEEAQDSSEAFELTLSGSGISIQRKVNSATAAHIMHLVLGGTPAPGLGNAAPTGAPSASSEAPVSLREYLDEVNASKKPDQIVAIGHFMSLHEGLTAFSKDDIKSRFSLAKEPMPANFPRDFNLALKSGAIAPAHQNAGYFYVTKSGIGLVQNSFKKK